MENKHYSIIDIETTGGHRSGNKITEIAIINIDDGKVVDEFVSLINPERSIPFHISRLTGISNKMVEDAPKFFQVAKKIVQMTEGRIFVAHNVFFDYNFIKHEFSDLGYTFQRDRLCTVRLARRYLPGFRSYSLGKLCDSIGIVNEARHRALGDARATTKLFQLILPKINKLDFVVADSRKLALPPHLGREQYERLPHSNGVYYFYDQDGKLLYVGKSKDIKKRVGQHFRPNMKQKKDIQLKNAIAKIEYKALGNELASLLFECHEIKHHFPPFNHSLKRKKFPYAFSLEFNDRNIMEILIVPNPIESENKFCFRSKRVAEVKKELIFQQILGTFETEQELEDKKARLLDKVGVNQFNDLLLNTLSYKLPKKSNFVVKRICDDNKECLIRVQNYRPVEMIYHKRGTIYEEIKLNPDADMTNVLHNYLHQHHILID